MKYLKTYENHKLLDDFLQEIHIRIRDEKEPAMNFAVAGQFRFYLEEKYPKKVTEYLYRITDGENSAKVVLDMSKDMVRDDDLYEMVHAIFPKYEMTCMKDTRDNYKYDITIGNTYTITDIFIENDIEYVELEYNDSDEPGFTFPKKWFL